MFNKYIAIFLLAAALVGCAEQSKDNYKARAAAEQEESNKVENDNLAQKARVMEQDLAARHAFYSAVEGDYQGVLSIENEQYNIKFTLVRSIPPFVGDRVRQLSEIENDLNNLYFHAQIIQWHPDDIGSAVPCRVTGVRPNIDDGSISIASTDCANLYSIFLSQGNDGSPDDLRQQAKQLAQKIKTAEVLDIPYLSGTLKPSFYPGTYSFKVKKTGRAQ